MFTIYYLEIPFGNTELKKYENISKIEDQEIRHISTLITAEKVHTQVPFISRIEIVPTYAYQS
jgi:hypothetical protein